MDQVYICELCRRAFEPEDIGTLGGLKRLKKFRGYTVDLRLQQFRNINRNPMQFIEFASPKGKKLLAQMHEEVTA